QFYKLSPICFSFLYLLIKIDFKSFCNKDAPDESSKYRTMHLSFPYDAPLYVWIWYFLIHLMGGSLMYTQLGFGWDWGKNKLEVNSKKYFKIIIAIQHYILQNNLMNSLVFFPENRKTGSMILGIFAKKYRVVKYMGNKWALNLIVWAVNSRATVFLVQTNVLIACFLVQTNAQLGAVLEHVHLMILNPSLFDDFWDLLSLVSKEMARISLKIQQPDDSFTLCGVDGLDEDTKLD
ncbi:hypothetical protein ACJX0J_037592, partial [Zea mays]